MPATDHPVNHRSTALDQHVRRLVDTAPPLSADQRDRLAVLLRPATTTTAPVQRAA